MYTRIDVHGPKCFVKLAPSYITH